MHSAYTPAVTAPPETAFERKAIGRIAAGIWAAIAFLGAIATIEPLRFPDMDVTATRMVVVSATVIAAVTIALPWARMPKAFVNLLLVTMAGFITALAWATGAVESPVWTLVTFAIALAVCFLPVRTSVAQVVMIAVLLAAGLVLVAWDNAGVDALRASLLLSVLLVLCGLVLILRAAIAEREAQVGHAIFHGGVLEGPGFEKLLDREVSRAARHSRPLSVVLLEVTPTGTPGTGPQAADERVVGAVAGALLDRIRTEDHAGHLGGLRFAVLAPETPATGAASIAETASELARETVERLGHDASTFSVVHGWADYPHHAETGEELLRVAQHNLEAHAVRNELRPSPTPSPARPSTRPAPAAPDQA
jgi:diguanylate cyclase (GGDEF)-like protein